MKNYISLSLLSLVLTLFSCDKSVEEKAPVEEPKSAFILSKKPVTKTLNLPAEIIPYASTEIMPKVEGYVERVWVDIGDRVKRGQVLLTLSAPEVTARSAAAGSDLQKARSKFESSKDRFVRIQKASKKQGAISETELISAKNLYLEDSSAWLSAQSSANAYSQLQSYLNIRAPFNGMVTKRTVDPGDLVSTNSGLGLMTVENPVKLRVRIHVPEAYVNSIPAADRLTFSTEAILNREFSAILARKSGSIDRDTRTELWEYEFDNKGGEIKSGMYATAQINLGRNENSFVVPASALVTSQEGKFVLRMKRGKVEWVNVTEGIAQESGKEIFGEIQSGDTLLTRGTDEIKPGTVLKVKL